MVATRKDGYSTLSVKEYVNDHGRHLDRIGHPGGVSSVWLKMVGRRHLKSDHWNLIRFMIAITGTVSDGMRSHP